VTEARFYKWLSPYAEVRLSVSVIPFGLMTFFVPVSSIRAKNQDDGIESVQVVEQARSTAKGDKDLPPKLLLDVNNVLPAEGPCRPQRQ
jgi:hypothetical protein